MQKYNVNVRTSHFRQFFYARLKCLNLDFEKKRFFDNKTVNGIILLHLIFPGYGHVLKALLSHGFQCKN